MKAETKAVDSLKHQYNANFAQLVNDFPDMRVMTENGERNLSEIADEIMHDQEVLKAIKTCGIG
jgi:ribosomal protein S19E (S16A)